VVPCTAMRVLKPSQSNARPMTSLAMALTVALASLAAAVLAGLGLAAYVRRRSRPYLLVALALAALLARGVVGALAIAGQLGPGSHHLIEHGLDAVMAALVIGAVYWARPVPIRGRRE
jgi:ABC-type spermidine/putrescine transport system permease subunit II